MSLGPSPTTEQEDKQNKLNELMAKFLAKGGKIQKIAYGERSYDSAQPGNRWGAGRKKKKTPPKPPAK